MTNTTETYKDALSCPICMETLTNPKILPCGHSFCLTPCLVKFVKQSDLMCPLCRTPIILPPSGKIEDLATNFSVKGLLEMLEKTEDQEKTSQALSDHTKEDGDYVCMTCLEQVCSCCQLSLHIDNNHKCVSVTEFTEKIQQDVSKMVTVINGLSWSEETERYTMASFKLVLSTYLNLQETITAACNEISQSLSEKKLNLRKIRQLQKQVKKDHSKFKAVWETLKQEIRGAKKQEVMKTQVAEYQQKLKKLKLPYRVYKKPFFCLKISSFENLKGNTEALIESLTQELRTGSFDILAMKESMHDIGENIGVIEQYIKDVEEEYNKFLLEEVGITGNTVEPHHLFRVLEAVDMMHFGSDRHSEDIMRKCDELIHKFLASKHFIRTSCTNLFEEYQNRSWQLAIAEERVVKILEEMVKCKGYYEDIYEVIGRNFVIYDSCFMREYVKNFLLAQDTSYVLQSTTKHRTQFMKNHLKDFEFFKQITKTQCKVLIRYLTEKNSDIGVVHEQLKAIEMRLEKTEYHYQLLKDLSSMELRCHEIAEEFEGSLLAEQTVTANIRRCYEHKLEVQRLWKIILQHKPTSILFDVHVITMLAKAMEERRNKVVSLLTLSKSELNGLGERMLKVTQIMELRARLHSTVNDILNNLSNTYHRHRQELEAMNLLSDISAYANPTMMTSCVRKYSLKDLLLLANQAKALNTLCDEIRSTFADDCNCVYQNALFMRCKLLRHWSSWLSQFVLPERQREEWHIRALTQENNDQWKTIADIVKTDNFDLHILEIRLGRALSLYDEVYIVSTKLISLENCLKIGLLVLGFVLLRCVLFYFVEN